MQNLKGRSFLALKDFTPRQIRLMLDTAAQMKKNKYSGVSNKSHEGKNIALLFEKNSTRTRCAFTVAAHDLGAHPEFLGKNDIQFGKKESVADTAKVLGRMFDGIQFRGFAHETVEELARHAGVPVWNGLTDKFHPTQGLADMMTIEENLGYLKGAKLAFVGDGRNNVALTLMFGSALMGLDFRIGAPSELHPDQGIVAEAQALIDTYNTGATITITDDPRHAVNGVDAIYTDVWVSMGEEDKFAERISLLRTYQVDRELLNATGNQNVKFLHCLPAFHDKNTVIGKEVNEQYSLDAMEVTDEVFSSTNSVVFDQAENRVYTIEAVMALTM
ncbi:ornithine carbamoyltransferase [Candidatus Saccharibacteria bacterium]|nr:MAG: ornithine carbamoyltransferase [Candidatus Saccharibacteria bacterium]